MRPEDEPGAVDGSLEYEDQRYDIDLGDDYNISGFLRVLKPSGQGATVGYVAGQGLMSKFQLSLSQQHCVLHDEQMSLVVELELRQNARELRGRVYPKGGSPSPTWTTVASW